MQILKRVFGKGAFSKVIFSISFYLCIGAAAQSQEFGIAEEDRPLVRGLTIGMTADSVEEFAEAQLVDYTIEIEYRNHENSGQEFIRQVILVGPSDEIRIYFTGAFSGNISHSIVRRVALQQAPFVATRNSIMDLYGVPTYTTAGIALEYLYSPERVQFGDNDSSLALVPNGNVFAFVQLSDVDVFSILGDINECTMDLARAIDGTWIVPDTDYCTGAGTVQFLDIRGDTIGGFELAFSDYALLSSAFEIDREADLSTRMEPEVGQEVPEL